MAHTTINGARLWYDVFGEGQPLFLHHGYTASRANWMPVAERLKDKYQIIMMECRGTGESEDTADGYNLDQYGADVIGLLDFLKLDKVVFAGHSMGGGIGYKLAINYRDRLDKLILMAPIPSGGIGGSAAEEKRSAALEARLTAKRNKDRSYFRQEQRQGRFREDRQTEAWMESRVEHLLRVSESHLLDGINTMQALNVTDALATLDIPTLMIAGGVDSLLDANIADYQRLPNASLHVLSRAGHDVAIHEPDGVSQAIDGFMEFGPLNATTLAQRSM